MSKFSDKNVSIKQQLAKIASKQDELLIMQKTLLQKEEEILKLEKKIYSAEEKNLSLHKKFDEQAFNLFSKKTVLSTVTYKDVFKAIIGAFFGVMGHFAFAKGVAIAHDYSLWRSSLLLFTSFSVLILFIYFSGFREVKIRYFLYLFPVRATVIYFSALCTVVFILLLYGVVDFSTPFQIVYNYVAAISILAVLGAGTSDLIGSR